MLHIQMTIIFKEPKITVTVFGSDEEMRNSTPTTVDSCIVVFPLCFMTAFVLKPSCDPCTSLRV